MAGWGRLAGAKTIKKNTNSTQNKSQTHRAKQYEVMSFLSTDCELSTETCSKNVYSLSPRCFIVCSSPHSHIVCPTSLNPHVCIRDLHRPVLVRRRFRLDQVGHASLEPGGSDSLGLNESLGQDYKRFSSMSRCSTHNLCSEMTSLRIV